MIRPVVSALLTSLVSLFRSSAALRLQNLALQHQLAVYPQTVRRLRLYPTDRLFWAWLSRLWPDWQQALAFVQPRTVLAWQKKRFLMSAPRYQEEFLATMTRKSVDNTE